MHFHSFAFLCFFVIVFLLYWAFLASRPKVRNGFLLLVSYLFYGWWDWRFLSLIIFSSAIDYWSGKRMFGREKAIRKRWLTLSLVANLGLLVSFKYFGFFADSLLELGRTINVDFSESTLNVLLPVGISFYTFQSLSYTIDIYRRELEPTSNWVSFFAFVAFFPQLVAGPIERAEKMLPQFKRKIRFRSRHAVLGLRLILTGLFKKLVVADGLGRLADPAFANPAAQSNTTLALSALFFALQIYADFSAYTDIARGTARLLGFHLSVNFRFPYLARSFRDFWRRWHISLSTWFRDYVFIPLGGSRSGSLQLVVAIIITFLLSGFWHGASLTFLTWGAIHACLYLISLRWLDALARKSKVARVFTTLFTFVMVSLAFVVFRTPSMEQAAVFYQKLFSAEGWEPITSLRSGFVLIAALLFIDGLSTLRTTWFFKRRPLSTALRWSFYAVIIGLILVFGQHLDGRAFIYFQF